jgi:proteasome lid subunit RPN8/RPN11
MPKPPSSSQKPDGIEPTGGTWQDSSKRRRGTFPGPRGAQARLRIAMEPAAFADLTAHARESLDAEVCGVLAGLVCEDDEGSWVHVQAALRGSAADSGKTHVTFTQETWTHIHEKLEREHPRLRMVGWYHTHPGFGVEFSEMDLFIQRNFFPAPAQIAYVTDPLGGAIAILTNTDNGVEYVERFWVKGREQRCEAPRLTAAAGVAKSALPGGADETLAARLGQLTQAFHELRESYHRFLLACAMFISVGLIAMIGWIIWRGLVAERKPPELGAHFPVAVQMGDKTVMLDVAVVKWEVPPEIDPLRENAELKKQLEDLLKKAGAAATPASGAPSPALPAATPAPPKATPAPPAP